MANVLSLITREAKRLRKLHPQMAWKTAIKQASASMKRQTGKKKSNVKADKRRKAKPPGRRVSADGNVYYERRRNRSDVPGTLTGIKSAYRIALEKDLGKALLRKDLASKKKDKRKAQKRITELRSQLRKLKS